MGNLDKDYQNFLVDLKTKISASRYAAIRAVNSELILLYWEIGKSILEKQKAGWGKKVIQKLSKDLSNFFPDMKGFSYRNLKYMRQFAQEWMGYSIGQQAVAQLPWGHNVLILQKLSCSADRVWYAEKALEYGWTRSVLLIQIESNLKGRAKSDNKTNNFSTTLSEDQSDLANRTLKDPYVFDFLSLGEKTYERVIEKKLIENIQKFLLELGAGFAYLGRQFHLEVGGEDFYLDLLFYHTRLHCYVVVELKTDKFKPEYAGKLNFYLTAVDEKIKTKEDNPTIGILLCKTKNKIVAEYTLKDMVKPMGISEFRIGDEIPEKIKAELPSIEVLEQELGKMKN